MALSKARAISPDQDVLGPLPVTRSRSKVLTEMARIAAASRWVSGGFTLGEKWRQHRVGLRPRHHCRVGADNALSPFR
jgi:hypothetical protein